ncbi:unnamed protein product, partial [Vitis vinifera]
MPSLCRFSRSTECNVRELLKHQCVISPLCLLCWGVAGSLGRVGRTVLTCLAPSVSSSSYKSNVSNCRNSVFSISSSLYDVSLGCGMW